MARANVSFVLDTTQIGTEAAGNDHISGLQLYGTAPGSFATSAQQAVFSLADAVTKGIALDYSDETVPRAIYTLSGTVTVGDTYAMTVTEVNPVTEANPTGTKVVSLGTATVSTAATPTGGATDMAAQINAGTYSHGYSATSALGVVTIIGRQGIGIGLNPAVTAAPLAVTVTGTSTGVITQQFGTGSGGATVGIYSKKAIWYYLVSEVFRANPSCVLWVGFTSTPSATFAELVTLQNAAKGAIKQMAVFDPTVTSATTFTSNGTILQARGVDMFANYTQSQIHYTANLKAVAAVSALENQQTKSNYYVNHVIMQDGEAAGAQLYINSGISIGNVGCTIGTTSKAAVNQDIGESVFNITNDTEMAAPAFITGQKVSTVASTLLDQLDAYRYMFATNVPNRSGTFIVNDWSSIVQTSPYNRQSRTRVMGKAIRLIYGGVFDLLKSQIQLNPDGTITRVSIERFDGAVIPVKTQMMTAAEISNMRITINPAQNIISTGKIVIGVAIQPTITADFIEVDMSFTAKI